MFDHAVCGVGHEEIHSGRSNMVQVREFDVSDDRVVNQAAISRRGLGAFFWLGRAVIVSAVERSGAV